MRHFVFPDATLTKEPGTFNSRFATKLRELEARYGNSPYEPTFATALLLILRAFDKIEIGQQISYSDIWKEFVRHHPSFQSSDEETQDEIAGKFNDRLSAAWHNVAGSTI